MNWVDSSIYSSLNNWEAPWLLTLNIHKNIVLDVFRVPGCTEGDWCANAKIGSYLILYGEDLGTDNLELAKEKAIQLLRVALIEHKSFIESAIDKLNG